MVTAEKWTEEQMTAGGSQALHPAFETTALVSEHPREGYSFRDWFPGAAVGLLVAALWRLPDPIRAWILVPGVVLAVLTAYYLRHLGRISVSEDVIRVRRWGTSAEYA